MNRVRFIEHEGRRIVLLDFSGMKDVPEGLDAIATARTFIQALPADGSALTLTDVTDTTYDRRIIEAMKEMTKANRPIVKAAAVVNTSAIHRAAISMVALVSRRKIEVFPTRAPALAWLVAQS
jgi:hypothetical protein